MMRFSDMRVATKVATGFAAVGVLLLAISAVGYTSLEQAETSFHDYRAIARQTNAIGHFQSAMLTMRIGVKNFLASGDQAQRDAVQAQAREAQAAGAALAAEVNAAQLSRFRDTEAELTAYVADFAKVADQRATETTELNKLELLGTAADRSLTSLLDAADKIGDGDIMNHTGLALRNLSLGRLYVEKFRGDGQVADAVRASEALAAATSGIDAVAGVGGVETLSLAAKAHSAVASYTESWFRLHQAYVERERLVHESLDKLGPRVALAVGAFDTENRARQDELGPRATASVARSQLITGVSAALAIALAVVAALGIGRGIARPIRSMTEAMQRLAEGDRSVEIPARGRRDEVGAMAEALQVFKDNAERAERLAGERAAEQAKRETRARAIEQLTGSFDSDVSGVLGMVANASVELESTAQAMTANAERTQGQATTAAAATEEAAAGVQAVATAAEELSSSIAEIGRQVEQSSRTAQTAAEEAGRADRTVKGLAEAATRIGAVVSLINQIAQQTNLLALNATIEAARAGEAGRGFAVVASEVKNLATQTARATEEISGQIAAVQNSTKEAVGVIGGIVARIDEVNAVASAIAAAVEQQSAATAEIARNVQQAAAGTVQVSSNIGEVTQATTETGSAAGQVLSAARELSREGLALRETVGRFLEGVRAA
jgi:methyl-accepting chemotaxis protein